MLYDPKWEKQVETKADPFTLVSLIAWLELQPPSRDYCFLDTGTCLLSQYFTAHGFECVNMGPFYFFHKNRGRVRTELPPHFNDIANGNGGARTFGAALTRTRAALR